MKLAREWIAEHGQSGDYPKVDEPVGCFTEAQIREIQMDAIKSMDGTIPTRRTSAERSPT